MPTKLGQNFLINENITKKMAQSANLTLSDFVLEIGSGKGILTEELAKYAGKVVAIEIDENLVEILKNKFKDRKNIKIINQDILKINLNEIIPHPAFQATLSHWERGMGGGGKYKVIANLPYYITSPIIRLFLESENPPSEMILMVQKEMAERIVASPSEIPTESRSAKRISRGKPGKMSILSVSVQYYAKAEILFEVGKENFDPMPEVNSAVIRITRNVQHGTQNKEGVKRFFRVVRAGFCAKRKTLANNLANSFHLDKKIVEEKMKTAGFLPIIRAQELSIDDWKKLASIF